MLATGKVHEIGFGCPVVLGGQENGSQCERAKHDWKAVRTVHCEGPGSVRQHESAAVQGDAQSLYNQPSCILTNRQYIGCTLSIGAEVDNMMSMELKTPRDVQRELARRFKARRLALNLTQEGLAARSGVSWSSLKRYEYTGLIAFDAVLKLAMVLDCLGDFDRVCVDDGRSLASKSLDELLREPKTRRSRRPMLWRASMCWRITATITPRISHSC